MRTYSLVIVAVMILLLGACGGGGGDGGDAQPSFTVAGTIQPDALNRVDSDTDDPETPAARNDQSGQAQPVVTPAIIGGFVAEPGMRSRFGPGGDPWDFFVADLRAGQPVLLEFPDASVADLDLYLVDRDGVVVDASIGLTAVESLAAPRDDRYFIAVHAFSGRSNYNLRLDIASVPAWVQGRRGPRLSDGFEPGELIVQTAVTDALQQGVGAGGKPIVEHLGLLQVAGEPAREQLWHIPPGHGERVSEALGTTVAADAALRWVDAGQRERYQTLVTAKALERHVEVVSVSPNYHVGPQRLPNDPLQGLQWFHRNIDLPEAWDLTTGRPPDAEVIIAVIDTGVFLEHVDLRDRLISGFDFISSPTRARDGDGIDPNPDDPGDSPLPGQSSWHGSHVAGIAAAATDNRIGIAGVSWGARIMPVRTVGVGGGLLYDTLQGIRYAAGLPNDSGTVPPRAADVINISLGGGAFSQTQADLYRQIRERGVFLVAAAGNDAGSVGFPAAYDAVLAVGATDAVSSRAPYSSFGDRLDLVAPGGDMRVDRSGDGYGDGILSTIADDATGTRRSAYAFYQGTSMATAVVSGVIALARSAVPSLTPDALEALLRSGRLTDDLGPPGWDAETGWGQINARKTIGAAREWAGAGTLPPLLSVSPERLEYGFTETSLELTLRNSGGGVLRVNTVTADQPWVAVIDEAVGTDGLGRYRVQVSRQGLSAGEYRASIRVETDDGGARAIPVGMRVAEHGLAEDTVGRIYVLLIDDEDATVAEVGVDAQDGLYRYRFEGVAPGEYRIVAGTDMNDDRFICDPGEACGAYPTLALFERVRVDRDLNRLDFSVGFRGQPGIAVLSRGDGELKRERRGLR